MSEFNKALTISRYNINCLLKSRLLWAAYGFCFLLTILNKWDDKKESLVLFNIAIRRSNRLIAFESLFFEIYNLWWIILIVVIIRKIMFPLKDSFTISSTLWLRFSNATSTTLAIARLMLVVFFSLLISVLSIIWLIFFLLVQHLDFDMIYIFPMLGLVGYVFFSSGIVVLFEFNHLISNNSRIMIVLTALFIPMGLFYFDGKITEAFNGYFPYCFPIGFEKIETYTLRAYLSSMFAGLFFLILHVTNKVKYKYH